MSRPDIIGDAQQIKDVILRGGVVILQGDVGYGLLTATPKAARKTIDVKGRAAHKRHGMLGCAPTSGTEAPEFSIRSSTT